MSYQNLGPGPNLPGEVQVIIEIPARSEPVKYEIDKATGAMFVDRFLTTAMYYPCDYGYIPQTLSDDGDPVDVLVIAPYPLICGSVIKVRPVGMLRMSDEKGEDVKILAVPADKLTPLYRDIKTPFDVPQPLLATITHFFEHYKDLEPKKWVKVEGWVGVEEAHQEILSSIERYRAEQS